MKCREPADDGFTYHLQVHPHFVQTPGLTPLPRTRQPPATPLTTSNPHPHVVNFRLTGDLIQLYRAYNMDWCPRTGLNYAGSKEWTKCAEREKVLILVIELKEPAIAAKKWRAILNEIEELRTKYGLDGKINEDSMWAYQDGRGVPIRFYQYREVKSDPEEAKKEDDRLTPRPVRWSTSTLSSAARRSQAASSGLRAAARRLGSSHTETPARVWTDDDISNALFGDAQQAADRSVPRISVSEHSPERASSAERAADEEVARTFRSLNLDLPPTVRHRPVRPPVYIELPSESSSVRAEPPSDSSERRRLRLLDSVRERRITEGQDPGDALLNSEQQDEELLDNFTALFPDDTSSEGSEDSDSEEDAKESVDDSDDSDDSADYDDDDDDDDEDDEDDKDEDDSDDDESTDEENTTASQQHTTTSSSQPPVVHVVPLRQYDLGYTANLSGGPLQLPPHVQLAPRSCRSAHR